MRNVSPKETCQHKITKKARQRKYVNTKILLSNGKSHLLEGFFGLTSAHAVA